MVENLLVSILVPIYNVEDYIKNCLCSVFNQTYSNLEFIFVDDCSTDQSLSLLNDYIECHGIDRKQITVIHHEKNQGIAFVRKECILNAKGDYVLFVDSDDWIDTNTVEMCVKSTNFGMIDIVGCDYMDEYHNGKSLYHYENYGNTCYDNLIRCLNYDISPVLWKLLVRRNLYNNFDIPSNINIGEDYAISIKLYYYANSFVALHQAYYHYVHYNMNKLSYQRMRSLVDHIKIVGEVEKFLSAMGMLKNDIKHQLNLRKFNIKSNFLTLGTLDYSLYKEVFPDVNGLWRCYDYTFFEKTKFWLAEKNFYNILSFLQKLKSYKKFFNYSFFVI